MNFQRLEATVMKDEGFRSHPYLDTEGIPTIGYGTTSILGRPVTMQTESIRPDIARQLLRGSLYGALVTAQKLFPRIREMGPLRGEVLVNMAYNLGSVRLARFTRLRRAAEVLDYDGMAREMKDSLWYEQVGTRSKRLVRQMRTGVV